MIWNADRRFIFIEVPKTGTSAVARQLLEIDPCCRRGVIVCGDGREVEVPVHATVSEIRHILGEEARTYTFIAFLREPVDVMISKYHFYSAGRAAQRSETDAASRGLKWRVALARGLPLPLWCAVYPFKSSCHFVLDRGKLAVDMLGDFSNLQSEVLRIFGSFGYPVEQLLLPVENKTDYARPSPLTRLLLQRIAAVKCSRDANLYAALRREAVMNTFS